MTYSVQPSQQVAGQWLVVCDDAAGFCLTIDHKTVVARFDSEVDAVVEAERRNARHAAQERWWKTASTTEKVAAGRASLAASVARIDAAEGARKPNV
jgi:hypothetical protein